MNDGHNDLLPKSIFQKPVASERSHNFVAPIIFGIGRYRRKIEAHINIGTDLVDQLRHGGGSPFRLWIIQQGEASGIQH
jgi:hypothetical protein